MLIRLAVGIRTARYVIAWIDTASLNARQVILAVVVRRALAFTGRDSRAASTVWISDHSFRTLAHVAALRVDAVCTMTARIIRAFVHVNATVLRIPLKASLAHASRRIARCAPRVNTAWEAIAGICTRLTEHVMLRKNANA